VICVFSLPRDDGFCLGEMLEFNGSLKFPLNLSIKPV